MRGLLPFSAPRCLASAAMSLRCPGRGIWTPGQRAGQVAGGAGSNGDYVFVLQEFFFKENGQPVVTMPPGNQFNFFTMNGKTRDAATTVAARVGEKVRIRLYNASNDVHSMHLHGTDMVIVSRNGHPVTPETVTTVDIGPGNFVEVDVVFDKPGKWTLHCHFPHHTGNDGESGPQGSPVGMTRIFDVTQ